MNRNVLFLAAALILGTVLYVKGCVIPDAIAGAKLDASRDSTRRAEAFHDSLQTVRHQDSLRWATHDSATSRDVARRTVVVVRVDSAGRKLTDSLQRALQADSSVSDSLRSLVQATVASLTTVRDTLLTITAQQDTLIRGLRGQLAQRDSTIRDLTAINQANRTLMDRYRAQASPNLFAQFTRAIPFMAATYILAKVTH